MAYVMINGALTDRAHAHIPLDDRGFRFGDGAFETMCLIDAVPYQWELHIERLKASLKALRIPFPDADLKAEAKTLMTHTAITSGRVRITITRGSGSMGYRPAPDIVPRRLIEVLPERILAPNPIALWHSQWRKPALNALPTNSKLMQGVNATLSILEALDEGCAQSLQLSAEGHISEASSSNIFWLSDGVLFTPALSAGCLAGTTRDALLRLWLKQKQEVAAPLEALQSADGVCICNTVMGVRPVEILRPQGWRWPLSTALAEQLGVLLSEDKVRYVKEHAHVWH